MTSAKKLMKFAFNYGERFLLGAGVAVCATLAVPILSGSNHTCPVLRQQDMDKGPSARAIPAFARKYKVDCTYCHTAWPQLNRTGLIFRYLGYRMPYEVPTMPGAATPQATSTPAIAKAELGQGAKIAEGHKVFMAMQCFTCHIDGGNLVNPAKPIKGQAFLKKYPEDSQIINIIRHGIAGTAMPAYGPDRLSDDQAALLVAYVRSLTPTKP